MNETTYPQLYDKLQGFLVKLAKESRGSYGAFAQLNQKALTAHALDAKVKELMCLAIGIAVHCDGCIAFHVRDALRAGATREEVIETLMVAVMMGGGTSAVYAAMAMEALDQFARESAGGKTTAPAPVSH